MLLAPFLAGCASQIGVRNVSEKAWLRHTHRSALSEGKPSQRSLRYLRLRDSLSAYEKYPVPTLVELHQGLSQPLDAERLFVLAELCYVEAGRNPALSEPSVRFHLSSARYAYVYFF